MSNKLTKEDKQNLYELIDKIILKDTKKYFLLDVVWKGIPELKLYPKIVKKPMCLNKVRNKVKMSLYKTPEQCFSEIQLIWDNCKLFNQEQSVINSSKLGYIQNCRRLGKNSQ
jgi:hypothetical protein